MQLFHQVLLLVKICNLKLSFLDGNLKQQVLSTPEKCGSWGRSFFVLIRQ